MSSVYQISEDILRIFNDVESAEGEITEDVYKRQRQYWAKFGVPLQFLNLNFIYPVEQYYINRNINPKEIYQDPLRKTADRQCRKAAVLPQPPVCIQVIQYG